MRSTVYVSKGSWKGIELCENASQPQRRNASQVRAVHCFGWNRFAVGCVMTLGFWIDGCAVGPLVPNCRCANSQIPIAERRAAPIAASVI